MSDPSVAAETHIYERLSADADLASYGIHGDFVPEGEAFPAVVYHDQSGGGTDRLTANGDILWTSMQYLVKVIGITDNYEAIQDASARLFTLLQQTRGGRVLACYREGAFHSADPEVDGEYRQLGHFFRMLIAPA